MAGEKWKIIDTGKRDDLKSLEIDLTKDDDEEISVVEDNKPNGDNTRTNVKADDRRNRVEADEEDEDSEARAEVQPSKEEDAEERPQVRQQQGESRRARRIRNQQARIQALEQALAVERQEKNKIAQTARGQSAKHMTEQKKFWDERADQLEEELEKAIASNDAKAQAKVARQLNDAQTNQKIYTAAAQEYENDDEDERPQQQTRVQPQQQQPVRPPEAAVRWAGRNPWFNKDQALTYKTLEVNNDMLQEGEFDPNSDEYYEELEKRLEDEGLNLNKLRGSKPVEQKPNQNRRSPVGGSGDSEDAPLVRQASKGKTQFKKVGDKIEVTPTDDDYDMAERLNVPIKRYMKSKLIYEQSGGKGYVDINVG